MGMSVDVALNILKTDGFAGAYTIERVPNPKDKDTVIEIRANDTTMAAGDKIDINLPITIVVSDGPNAEAGVRKAIEVQLSEDFSAPYTVVIKQGDAMISEVQVDEDEQEKVTVELVGTGKQIYDIYINGNVYMKIEVDFTT